MVTHPDLQSEQAHIDRAYQQLEAMRSSVSRRLESALSENVGGTPQAMIEREMIVDSSLHRLEQLDLGRDALCFGRIDTAGDDESSERFYIGRLAVSDVDQEPLVVDWRAPIAEPFYRATGRHPMGLRRRRHFSTDGPRLLGIEDELFSDDSTGVDGELAGPGTLLAAMERSRSGRMRDIVATVQREQDEIIRADLAGILVVQGGPGTGKTAVALHRAAYLLYTHRFPLERQGVPVVGPNPLFLRYIEQVLPSLGESGVVLTTPNGMVPDTPVRAADARAVAAVKADVRMAKVIAKAVRDRQRPLRADLVVPYGPHRLRVSAAASAEIVASVKRRPGAHNARRRQVETHLLRRLFGGLQSAVDRAARLGAAPENDQAELDFGEFRAEVRRRPEVVEALERMWPRLTPQQLLHDLFGALPLLELAAANVLARHEWEALHRPRAASVDDVTWTATDLPLLDEAGPLLGPLRPAANGPDEGPRTYGHIVVDEAQDLTPMQLRMIARRSLSGSMTIVGDVAQATGPVTASGWGDVVAHLPQRKPARVVELSVNYRTPAEIMEVAGRVLRVATPGLDPPSSVRSAPPGPRFVATGAADVASVAASEAKVLAGEGGSVAVIVAGGDLAAAGAALATAGIDYGDAVRHGLEQAVTLVGVDVVKGLEFDGVVVVEPARIVDESHQGLRALYVALTRATKQLTIVHGRPLPDALRPD